MKTPEVIIHAVWHSLLGEIYPEIRAISINFDNKKQLTIRYFLEREPIEFDIESLDIIADNVTDHTTSNNEISSIVTDAIFTQDKLADVDFQGDLVYARREYLLPAEKGKPG